MRVCIIILIIITTIIIIIIIIIIITFQLVSPQCLAEVEGNVRYTCQILKYLTTKWQDVMV